MTPVITTIVINGMPTVGKDTFVDYCIEVLQSKGIAAAKVSSVDAVKQAAAILGWDGVKDAKGRQFLSDLKDMSTQLYEGPMNYMQQKVLDHAGSVMFFFIREPEEIAKFVEAFPGSLTVIVKRNVAERFDNHADSRVERYDYDCYTHNDGDLDKLRNKAEAFVFLNIMAGNCVDV